jgi:hypothetical protein
MAWNYDPALSTDKDWVRFLVGDVDTNNQLIADETIVAVLGSEANKFMAAAMVAEAVARELMSGGVLDDRKVGETRLRYKRAADLKLLADQLRKRGSTHMKPSGGGIYTSDRDTYDDSTTLDKPKLAKGMHNYPGTDQEGKATTGTD